MLYRCRNRTGCRTQVQTLFARLWYNLRVTRGRNDWNLGFACRNTNIVQCQRGRWAAWQLYNCSEWPTWLCMCLCTGTQYDECSRVCVSDSVWEWSVGATLANRSRSLTKSTIQSNGKRTSDLSVNQLISIRFYTLHTDSCEYNDPSRVRARVHVHAHTNALAPHARTPVVRLRW